MKKPPNSTPPATASTSNRLNKARQQHNTCRVEVLRLEEQERSLPDLAAAYARAKQSLTQAEQAYQAYVQL